MSIIMDILEELCKPTLYYKGMSVNLFGLPKFKNCSKNSFSGSLAYMQKRGLLEHHDGNLRVTPKGREYIKNKYNSLKQFDFKFEKNSPKNLIVMFDIPETKRAEREWLRWHLKKFNYSMIQKSVWVGTSPLPKEFLEYLKKIDIADGLKTFKLAKGYVEKK